MWYVREMVAIAVPPPLAPVVWAVGVHGATDAWTHRTMLPWYLLAVPPWPHTSTLLTVASVAHFSEDIGAPRSLLLHTCIVSTALASVPAAVAITLCYLCAVHVPAHARRVAQHSGPWVAHVLWALGAILLSALFMRWYPPLDAVPDAAQRVACVHVALHIARPLSASFGAHGDADDDRNDNETRNPGHRKAKHDDEQA